MTASDPPARAATIRAGEPGDIPELLEIYNHHIRTSEATFDLEPHTLEQRQAWFAHYAPQGRHRLLVAEADGRVVGYATSSVFRPRAAYDRAVEATIYLAPDATGQGLGTRLYQALFDALAATDVHRVIAAITWPNPASLALHSRFGFQEVGRLTEIGWKFDRWWDVIYLEKRMEPKPPRP